MKRSVPRLQGAAKEVARGELIGLDVRIHESSDAGVVGTQGRVVDETLRTLTIRREDGREARYSKAGNVFAFARGGRDVLVEGRAIEFRPWDRAKKVK